MVVIQKGKGNTEGEVVVILSFCLSVCLSAWLSVCLSACLSVLSVCLSCPVLSSTVLSCPVLHIGGPRVVWGAVCFYLSAMCMHRCLRPANANLGVDPLVEQQLNMIGQGQLHPQHAVQLCRAAKQAGLESAPTTRLGKCGTHNAERNLMRVAEQVCDPYSLRLPLEMGEDGAVTLVTCAVLNMYELFAGIFAAGTQQFTISFLGGDEHATKEFWEAASRSSVFCNHPVLQMDAHILERMIPLLLFYDGADIFRDKEYLWFIFSSILTSGSEIDCEFPLLCLPACFVKEDRTLRMVMFEVTKWINWNIQILTSGVGPEKGYYGEKLVTPSMIKLAGKSLANGWRACFGGATMDYKARKEWNGFTRYYRCRLLCDGCLGQNPSAKADKSLTAFDFTHGAKWHDTVLTSEQVEASERHVLPLSMIAGWNSEMTHRDTMHTHQLGGSRDSTASTIASLLDLDLITLDDDPPDMTLKKLHNEMNKYCFDKNVPKANAPTLSLRMIGRSESTTDFPEMSSTWKASANTVLIFFLAYKTELVCRHSDYQKLIAVHCWALADYLWICKHSDSRIEFTEQEQKRALHAGRVYLVSLQALSGIARRFGMFLWRTRPKNHYFDHTLMTLKTSRINPMLFTTMRKESMLGKLKRIGKACSKKTVGKRVLQRWMVLQCTRFRQRQRTGQWKLNPRASKIPQNRTPVQHEYMKFVERTRARLAMAHADV